MEKIDYLMHSLLLVSFLFVAILPAMESDTVLWWVVFSLMALSVLLVLGLVIKIGKKEGFGHAWERACAPSLIAYFYPVVALIAAVVSYRYESASLCGAWLTLIPIELYNLFGKSKKRRANR